MANNNDFIIVGAGPSGLQVSLAARKMDLSFRVIDALPHPGGPMRNFYPDNSLFALPSDHLMINRDYINMLLEKIEFRENELLPGTSCHGLSAKGNLFSLTTSRGDILASAVVLCPGALVLGEVDDICFNPDSVDIFAGKNVLVYGGRQEATGWVTEIGTVANSVLGVTPCNLTDKALMEPDASLSMTALEWPLEMTAIQKSEKGKQVTLKNLLTGQLKTLEVDYLVEARQHLSSISPFASAGLQVEENRIVVDSSFQTSIPGVFAMGPCSTGSWADISFGELEDKAATVVNSLLQHSGQ